MKIIFLSRFLEFHERFAEDDKDSEEFKEYRELTRSLQMISSVGADCSKTVKALDNAQVSGVRDHHYRQHLGATTKSLVLDKDFRADNLRITKKFNGIYLYFVDVKIDQMSQILDNPEQETHLLQWGRVCRYLQKNPDKIHLGIDDFVNLACSGTLTPITMKKDAEVV